MKRFATPIAMLAVMGAITVAAPALAAPPQVDCRDPANSRNPVCMNMHKPGGMGGPGSMHKGGPGMGNPPGNPPSGPKPPGPMSGPMSGPGPNNGPGPGMHDDHGGPGPMMAPPGNWSRHDRDAFRNRFGDFHFSPFPRPDFAVRPGVRVPRHFALRPLPPQMFRWYPYYRGFLFFRTRSGDIVIVNPRTYRIVAII